MFKPIKVLITISVIFLFVFGSVFSAFACEKEMARALGRLAGKVATEYEVAYVWHDVNRLSKGMTYAYNGKRFAGVGYVWAAIPYDDESQDLDMYVFDSKTEELIVKDESSNPVAVIYSKEPAPYTIPVTTVIKMAQGSGCYGYIIFSNE